jgi:hypothetical protein
MRLDKVCFKGEGGVCWTAVEEGKTLNPELRQLSTLTSTSHPTTQNNHQHRPPPQSLPVYAAAHWAGADPDIAAAVLAGVRAAGYEVLQGGNEDGGGGALPRETRALVEYEVAMRAERFLGNSVSTFSALAILQRRQAGRWAGYYNGGDIPLVQVLPLFTTPWVFTFNSWSKGYEPMLRAAVTSALKQGGITPHCVFAGDAAAPVARWMAARGVRVIPHDPAWRDALVARVRGHAAANLRESHLFASEDSIVGTWQRIDLPLVPWIDQFNYVLFTDTDVLFRRPFSFHELPLPLPRAVGMGPEMVDMFPYNAGVMVANLPRLRETYSAFLAFILANGEGLTFPGYGPGDQVRGALLSASAWGRVGGGGGLSFTRSRSRFTNQPTPTEPDRPHRAPTTSFTRPTSAPGASPPSSTPSPTTPPPPPACLTWPSSTSTGPSRPTIWSTPPRGPAPSLAACARRGCGRARARTSTSGCGGSRGRRGALPTRSGGPGAGPRRDRVRMPCVAYLCGPVFERSARECQERRDSLTCRAAHPAAHFIIFAACSFSQSLFPPMFSSAVSSPHAGGRSPAAASRAPLIHSRVAFRSNDGIRSRSSLLAFLTSLYR